MDYWRGVGKIDIEPDYVIIYVGPGMAHIIPRANMLEGNFDEFVEKAKFYFQESKPNYS